MAELTADDVEAFTGGRLSADDDETARMLAAALAAARADVGWHVSPVRVDDVITVNGPGGYKLRLPTRKIVALTEVEDNGVVLDIPDSGSSATTADVVFDAEVPGLLIRQNGCWSTGYSSVVVTLDHGFTEVEAADWRQAILQTVSDMSAASGRSDADLVRKEVDDVVYQWGPIAAQAIYSVDAVLARYRITMVFA